jgi:hypothetical protein
MSADLTPALSLLAGFTLSAFLLAWLSRQIGLSVQMLAARLTGLADAAVLAIFLVFLPGVIVHEAAHWLTAKALGLRTGKFRVWPKRTRHHIGLGSVSVESGGPLLDSIVGLAPLVVGSVLIVVIANAILGGNRMSDALLAGEWRAGAAAFVAALRQADAAIWAYLLFAIANAMMPSASDREPVKPVLLYTVIAGILYVALGLPTNPLSTLMLWMTPALQVLTSAFLFTIVLDVGVLIVLFVLRFLARA